MKRRLIFIIVGSLLLGVGYLFGATTSKSEDQEQLNKFSQFFTYLTSFYLEDVDSKPLVESAIRAMLKELDPHSVYYDADEMKGIRENLGGGFSGIGVEFKIMDDTLRVVNTIVGGPSEKVGVMANDRIIRIDTLDAIGISQSEVPKRLRGERGSRVTIEVVRVGEPDVLHFTITRDNIPINTIDAAYKLTPTSGYIKVNRFGETTMEEFKDAYKSLDRVESLVLDLRGNGGGLLSQGVELANFFLERGSIIVTTEGEGVEPQIFRALAQGRFTSGKLVVLIDESSASASEIVAGAIQDWDRGIVMGRTSFGKGLVQRQYPLADGSAVRITIARYHTPSGRVIQRPYTNGNKEEYYKDFALRKGGVERSDSVGADRGEVYKTMRLGREVYGGGGITPDIEIASDTTTISRGYSKLIRLGVINNYTLSLLDKQRISLLERYPTFELYEQGFEVTMDMILALLRQAGEGGMEVENIDPQRIKDEASTYIKALIAQRLYSTSAFYKILNDSDTVTFSRVKQLLYDWDAETKVIWKK